MIQLRPYQEKIITETQKLFASGKKRILVTAPTGSGKTVVFSELAKRTAYKNKKVMILTNRIELLFQAGGSIAKKGITANYIEAGAKNFDENSHVYIAMSQTLKNRVKEEYWLNFLKNIDLFIIDECHLQDFNYILELEELKSKFFIGFTATPKRSAKQRQLGVDYEEMIQTVSIKELIRSGFLVSSDYYGFDVPDLSNVEYNSMSGDYREKSMYKAFDSKRLYSGVVKNWLNLVPGTKTLVFCCNIAHAIKTCKEFNENGITAKYIVSGVAKPKLPKNQNDSNMAIYSDKKETYDLYTSTFSEMSGERDVLLEDFKNSKFLVLINASILTTGYDDPSIETVVINRATLSLPLWMQMLGRGLRIFNNKTHFNILDFGGNQGRLGSYDEEREFSLWHEESKGGGIALVKRCGFNPQDKPIYSEKHDLRFDKNNKKVIDGCGRYIHAGLTICPFCGFKYPDKEMKDVELENIFYNETLKTFEKTKPVSKMNDDELRVYCEAKGHNRAWLWRQIYMKGAYKRSPEGGFDRIKMQSWSLSEINSALNYCKRFS